MHRRSFLVYGSAVVGTSVAGGCLLNGSERVTPNVKHSARAPRQFQYDAKNTGVTGGDAPESATVAWETTVEEIQGIARLDDRLVVAASSRLYAFDPGDGAKLWEVEVGHNTGMSPALTNDTAYVTVWNGPPDRSRGVAAIDLTDGSERWRAVPDVDVSSAPTVEGGTVYVGGSVNSDELIAIDASDGSERWRFGASRLVSTPAVADGTVFIGGGKSHVAYAVDAETGEERWQVETDGEALNAPTVVDETVYVPVRSGHLYALDATEGTERWNNHLGGGDDPAITGSVAATTDAVYAPTGDAIVALDSDGTEQWRSDGQATHAPVVADDDLLATGRHAICLDAASGEEAWRHEIEARDFGDNTVRGTLCEPVVANGTAFVGTWAGDLYAFRE